MKRLLLTSVLFLFYSSSLFALYDIVNFNTQPTGDEIKFCFSLDTVKVQFTPELYIADKFYLAALDKQNNILFLNQTPQGLTVTPWGNDTSSIVPFFTGKTLSEMCIGPFARSLAQEYQLVAGLGSSLEDVLAKQRYTSFFTGDISLPQAPKLWTVMVYMVGSDLESRGHWASKDFMEMLAGSTHSTSAHLIVSTGGSTRQGWNTVKRIDIENGQQYVIEDLGPKNMAYPQTLIDFVTWAVHQFPAQHHALILWNHGDGANGYGYDTSEAGGGKLITLPELHQAYQTIRQQLSEPLDIVVYDACLMGSIEVAEVTSTVANAMAASAELEPGHGIHYAHLLENLNNAPSANGLEFGRLVKTGYLQQAKEAKTFDSSPITYSVFDLTQLPSLTTTLKQFATEFKNVLEKTTFLDYERLSRGIIRAPGYPSKQTGRLRSLDTDHIRIDLYDVLKTVLPEFPEFKTYANELLAQLDRTVVDYEGNIAEISPSAGRVSIDIGRDKSYLAVLPEAYTLLSEGLDYYNRQKQADLFQPEGELVPYDCPLGLTCAAVPNWLELQTEDILGVDAYLGQKVDDTAQIYFIQSLYQRGETSQNLELKIPGENACRYQLCVNQNTCEEITVTKQRNLLLAEVSVNNEEAILSFCPSTPEHWKACSLVQQSGKIWGREGMLVPEDQIVPRTLTIQGEKLQQQMGQPLRVDDEMNVTLQKDCQEATATIFAAYYSLNNRRQFAQLCVGKECESAGVYLKE